MSVATAILAELPDSYWPLNETSGSFIDQTGAFDGTAFQTPSYAQPPITTGDVSGYSVFLDNADPDAIDFGNVYDFTGSSQFTAYMWVKPGTYAESYFWAHVDAAARGWALRMTNPVTPTWTMMRGDAAGYDTITYADTLVNYESGVARQVAMRYNGTNLILNINGVDVATGASAKSMVAPVTYPVLRFGAYGGSGNGYKGYVDDLAIWARALSAAELLAIYQAGSPVEEGGDVLARGIAMSKGVSW